MKRFVLINTNTLISLFELCMFLHGGGGGGEEVKFKNNILECLLQSGWNYFWDCGKESTVEACRPAAIIKSECGSAMSIGGKKTMIWDLKVIFTPFFVLFWSETDPWYDSNRDVSVVVRCSATRHRQCGWNICRTCILDGEYLSPNLFLNGARCPPGLKTIGNLLSLLSIYNASKKSHAFSSKVSFPSIVPVELIGTYHLHVFI